MRRRAWLAFLIVSTTAARAGAQQTEWDGGVVRVAPYEFRKLHDAGAEWRGGVELAAGIGNSFHGPGDVRLTTHTLTTLRAFALDSYAITFTAQSLAAGWRIGPLEPEVRAGFSWLTIDRIDGDWSVGMFSPRVSGGVAVHLAGHVLLGVSAWSEYLWRWLAPSALLRGAWLELRWERFNPSGI